MGFLRPRKDHKLLSPSHKRSKHQEEGAAKRLGGKRVVGSGSGFHKGDVRVKGIMRLECKTTIHKSFSLTLEMVLKIQDQAMACGEIPAMEIEYIDKSGKKLASVAVVPLHILNRLIDNEKGS